MAITVVGSVALDSIRTPKGEVEDALGGTATHFSNSASLLSEINLIGVVGDDYPKEGFDFFRTKKVDLEGLQIINGGKTFRWKGLYEGDMNVAITLETQLNVFESFNPKIPDKYKECDYLFLGNINPELQQEVLNQVKPKYASILDTMNLWINIKKEKLLKVIQGVDIIIVNDQELRDLIEEQNVILAGKSLLKLGPKYVVMKKGEHGAAIFSKEGEYFSLPAYPLEHVNDPTGAGDSFAGGFISYLESKKKKPTFENLKKALAYAIIVSSYYVEDFGIYGLENINSNNINDRYEEFKEYILLPNL